MIEAKLRKTLGKDKFIINMDFSAETGFFYSLSGRSGAGKTTFLRLLSGLAVPDNGFISVDGRTWFDSESSFSLPPGKRKIGFVFQQASLFPNMTVRQNVSYASSGSKRTDLILKLCDIEEISHRYPASLSGGQKQRVAVARALSNDPALLLLDEPFSALDPELRSEMQDMLSGIQKETGVTVIMVTHDIREIFRLSAGVFIMEKGRIVREGTPVKTFLNGEMSSKFSFYGEILKIIRSDVLSAAIVAVENQIIEVVLTAAESDNLHEGDPVIVAAKAFQTVISKTGNNRLSI